MQEPASAFATLGLEPGADRAAIEQAYRRLIKQYHPDKRGGDAARAAEINRAYRELREPRSEVGPETSYRPTQRARYGRRRRGRRRARGRLWPPVVIALGLVVLIQAESIIDVAPGWAESLGTELKPVGSGRRVSPDISMEEPLTNRAIGEAVIEASRLAEQGKWSELAQRSRDCHRTLRAEPSIATLDRCAALDDAAVVLDEREGIRERGPFSGSAVTTRHMTAASILSSDYLAIGERLDRIRTAVDLLLVPVPPQAPSGAFEGDQSLGVAATEAADAAPLVAAPDEAGAD